MSFSYDLFHKIHVENLTENPARMFEIIKRKLKPVYDKYVFQLEEVDTLSDFDIIKAKLIADMDKTFQEIHKEMVFSGEYNIADLEIVYRLKDPYIEAVCDLQGIWTKLVNL